MEKLFDLVCFLLGVFGLPVFILYLLFSKAPEPRRPRR